MRKLNEGWAIKNKRGVPLIRTVACLRRLLRDNIPDRNWEKLKKDGYKIVKIRIIESK